MSSDLDARYEADNAVVDAVSCPWCKARKGSRCRKPSGSVTPAHRDRIIRREKLRAKG